VSELLELSAVDLAARVRRREFSPVEVVEAHIARIEEVNPALNAVVVRRFEEARAEARRAEQAVMEGAELGPLHGVPMSVKEFLAVRGMPHTAGIRARAHVVAEDDATTVARVRQAGAIVLGLTNAPEGGLWHETHNPVYGRTSNPWDLDRTPGGSSGGEAAIIAAGGSPLGLGSDTGGSIRLPAAFCGIVGHKPSGGRVPITGHYPPNPVRGRPMLSVGPMARRVEDATLLLKILSGADGIDPYGRDYRWRSPNEVDWSKVRVVPMPEVPRARVRPEMAAAVHKATQALAGRGARVVEAHIPEFAQAFDIWSSMLAQGPMSLEELVADGERIRARWELLRWPFGRAHHAGGVLAILLLERFFANFPRRARRLAALAPRLEARLDELLGDDGLIVHPPYIRTAPRHRRMAVANPWAMASTTLFNVTASPVTVLPIDVDGDGMPIAVQLAGRRGRDDLTLAAASLLEAAYGGWVRPVEPRRRRGRRAA